MNRSLHKLKHIQEANKKLELRLIQERDMNSLIESALNEARYDLIQQGDDLCDILCGRKVAAYGSNGDVVKQIQSALAKCGHNVENEGGGINQGCKDDYKNCDGKFRKETKKAVESFQKGFSGLVVDGVVGPETLKVLGEKCIQLPNCDCENQIEKDVIQTDEWWLKIGIDNPNYGDCKYINACIAQALNNTANRFSWEDFLSCMKSKIGVTYPKKGKCYNCPKYADYRTWPKDNRYTDLGIEECVKKGCTTRETPAGLKK